MKIQLSHSADPDDPLWFIVRPLPGEAGNEQAAESLRSTGRTVIEVDVVPWQGYHSAAEARLAMREQRRG